MTMRIRSGAIAAAAAVLLLVPVTAGAAKNSSTTLKLTSTDVDFGASPTDHEWIVTGSLKSGARACVRGRSVRLTENGAAVGTSKSRSDGSFTLRFPLEGNTATTNYKATAAQRKVGRRKRQRICKPDSAFLGFFGHETTISIAFDNALDRFSGGLAPQECAHGNGWLLFAGSIGGTPIAGGNFDQLPSNEWSHDYGSQPPAGTYTVATGFHWSSNRGPAGALNVGICPSAISQLTV
jgi:hypothetical protein